MKHLTEYFEFITHVVCNDFNIHKDDLFSGSRVFPIPMGRAVLIKALRDKGLTTTKIGKLINRDHATVLYSLRKHNSFMEDGRYQVSYETICEHDYSISLAEQIKYYGQEIEKIKTILAKLEILNEVKQQQFNPNN